MDIQSDDESSRENDTVFDFKQNLYEQALDSAERKEDPWKELDPEDITDWQEEINYKEAGSEYTDRIRVGNFEVQHECLKAFAPLSPVTETESANMAECPTNLENLKLAAKKRDRLMALHESTQLTIA